MVFFEVTGLRGLNVNHADDAVLGDEWDRQFGADMLHRFNVLAFLGHIVDQDGAALFYSAASHAFTHFHADFFRHLRLMADLKVEA